MPLRRRPTLPHVQAASEFVKQLDKRSSRRLGAALLLHQGGPTPEMVSLTQLEDGHATLASSLMSLNPKNRYFTKGVSSASFFQSLKILPLHVQVLISGSSRLSHLSLTPCLSVNTSLLPCALDAPWMHPGCTLNAP